MDDTYGFINPSGDMFYSNWGTHEEWARNYCLRSAEAEAEFDAWCEANKEIRGTGHAGDFLVYEKGWVLFHNPAYGLPKPTFTLEKITKRQIETILDLYMDIRFDYSEYEITEARNNFLDAVSY